MNDQDQVAGLRAHHVVHPWQINRQHFAIQKQQCRQRLVLRARCNLPAHRQIGQEALNLGRVHFMRAALAVARRLPRRPARCASDGVSAANGVEPRPADPVAAAADECLLHPRIRLRKPLHPPIR